MVEISKNNYNFGTMWGFGQFSRIRFFLRGQHQNFPYFFSMMLKPESYQLQEKTPHNSKITIPRRFSKTEKLVLSIRTSEFVIYRS